MPPPPNPQISLRPLFSSLPLAAFAAARRRRSPSTAASPPPHLPRAASLPRLAAPPARLLLRPPHRRHHPCLHRRSQEPIAMPASDKQLASTVKKVTSRELPKKGADVVNMSQGTSPLPKDKGTATEPGKTVGTKRSDAPSSPGYHNVYVRRKVENDHSKVSSSQEVKGNGRDKTKEQETQQNVQHDQTNKPEVSSSVAVQHDQSNKPDLSSSVAVQHDQTNKPELSSSVAVQHDQSNKPDLSSSVAVQHDQTNKPELPSSTYLESCDRSTQEGYMRMLRSLSAADRSMHAIDLEKRAIHLLVEEGKELQRMKALNVLGKVSPNVPSKQAPL
uniref:Uncharacterized protein n=1 Tax=Oryza glumipatula TaxID=40148 RepID=A0A0E0AZA0_9ORYZ